MFRIIVHILLFLALAVLIGAIAFFGAGVASVVFQPGLLPSRTLAGAVNGAVLHRLNIIQGVCAVIIPIALGYLAYTQPREGSRVGFWLSIPLLIVVLYLGLKLFPEVNALRLEINDFDHILAIKEPLLERFQSLHKLYSRLTQGVLITGLLIFIGQVIVLAGIAGRVGRAAKKEGEKLGNKAPVPASEPKKEKKENLPASEPKKETAKKPEPEKVKAEKNVRMEEKEEAKAPSSDK